MMDDWDFNEAHLAMIWADWGVVDPLTISDAALLLEGASPSRAGSNEFARAQPKVRALIGAVRTGELKCFAAFQWGEDGSLEPTAPNSHFICDKTEVRTSELARWADARGIPHRWETKAEEEQPASPDKQPAPISTKERNHLVSVIGALALKAGLEPGNRGEGQRLQAICDEAGVALGSDKARDIMRLASTLLKNRRGS